MTGSGDDVSRSIERFLGILREHADETDLARRVADEASHATPEAAPEPLLRAELEAASIESLRAFLSATTHGMQAVPTVPAAAVEFARTLAQRRLGLAVLLNTYRVGQSAFWRTIMAEAAVEIPDADERTEVLMRLWDQLIRWLDFQLTSLSDIHETERDRFVRGALARRIEIVNAIVAHEIVVPEDAERALGHDLHRLQTAFVLWGEDAEVFGDTLNGLELLAHQLAAAVDSSRPLLVPSGTGSLWAWIATSEPPSVEVFATAPALQDGTRKGAVGRTGPGVHGFQQSHREALSAQRIALAVDHPSKLTAYGEIELLALLSQDVVAARTLVAHELAALNGSDRTSDHLRATALAYLLAGGNAAAAARQLGIHKNTVHYRLRRVEELLGRPLEPSDTKIQLALQLSQAFGSELAELGD